jgi:hypothetical protein
LAGGSKDRRIASGGMQAMNDIHSQLLADSVAESVEMLLKRCSQEFFYRRHFFGYFRALLGCTGIETLN